MTAEPNIEKPTVLAVDDETENLEIVRRCLAARPDLNVLVAYSASQALALLKGRTVDVLVVDQRMPEMTGVELVKCARAIARPPTAIMVTAYPEDPEVIAANKQGFLQCILSKPWKIEDLLLAVDMALRMRKNK